MKIAKVEEKGMYMVASFVSSYLSNTNMIAAQLQQIVSGMNYFLILSWVY